MRIAVTGEGPTDYGRREYAAGQWEWKWGPIAIYLKRIAALNNVEIELIPIERERVQEHRLQKRRLSGLEGKAIPSRKFAKLMIGEKCQYGIYYCDADRETGTKNSSEVQARRQFEKRYNEVRLGLESESSDNKIPMIPMRMIENWIMADQCAIEEVYEKKYGKKVVPANCELLWGEKNDLDSNYPKNYLIRMIRSLDKKYEKEEVGSEAFCSIAEKQNLETLREQCNISFEKFYQDYTKLLNVGKEQYQSDKE